MMGGLPGSQAQLPASSPSVSGMSHASGDLQTDTPPHTPPTGKLPGNCPPGSGRSSSGPGNYLYNGLANGYNNGGQMSPSSNMDASKLLNFSGVSSSSSSHLGAFKMM